MSYLVVASTSTEIAPFIQHLRKSKQDKRATDVLITGVGLTATTWALTRQIYLKRPELIIQAGVCGCFDKKVKPGTVMAVTHDTIADMTAVEGGKLKTIFDLGLAKRDQFPYTDGWLANRHLILTGSRLPKAKAISVNEISTNVRRIALYQRHFNPLIESMEGAALHYTALMENIPFIQLRAVSNYVGERNKQHWKLDEAIQRLNKELLALFNRSARMHE